MLKVQQNQIVNLTVKNSKYGELAGCIVSSQIDTTLKPKYTISLTTAPAKGRSFTEEPPLASTEAMGNSPNLTEHASYYENVSSVISDDYLGEYNTSSGDVVGAFDESSPSLEVTAEVSGLILFYVFQEHFYVVS